MGVLKSILSDNKATDIHKDEVKEKSRDDPELFVDSPSNEGTEGLTDNFDEQTASQPEAMLKRSLDNRHIQFIALGGSIGTGFFIGSGSTLASGGPAFLMIGFIIMGFMIMTCLLYTSPSPRDS